MTSYIVKFDYPELILSTYLRGINHYLVLIASRLLSRVNLND